MPTEHWRKEASNWVRWARAPGHDAYWDYRDSFFDIVPPPLRKTIEVGCGEGRVTRDLTSRGHSMTAIDASPTMIRFARDADATGGYLVADAAALPFPAASFDLAIAYNSLMDVDDMPTAVAETARVLRPGGRLCVCITHPINDAGTFSAREAGAPFIITEQYLESRTLDETFLRAGLEMRFHSKRYPLEDYSRAFEAAGLVIESLREPAADAEAVERDPSERRWQRIPMFLQLRLLKH